MTTNTGLGRAGPVRAALAGTATGSRSVSALAACARTADRGGLRARPVQIGLTAGQLGEVVGDKLPQTPSRLEFPGLAARLLIGGLVGGIACRRSGGRTGVGVVTGVVASAASSVAGARARAALAATLGSDVPGAVFEDVAALALAAAAVRRE